MTRVRFTADFDYRPIPQVTIGYLAGMEETVKRDCAAQAIAAEKAIEIEITTSALGLESTEVTTLVSLLPPNHQGTTQV